LIDCTIFEGNVTFKSYIGLSANIGAGVHLFPEITGNSIYAGGLNHDEISWLTYSFGFSDMNFIIASI